MTLLAATPPDKLVDNQNRPYFLWDTTMTIDEFRERLTDTDPAIRAYFIAKLMRQAKPDDVFTFIHLRDIVPVWPAVSAQLGQSRPFWAWLLDVWERQGHV
jgi:hypothetical protein